MIKDDLTIVLAGEAGQGIQSIETILVGVLKSGGYNIYATKEYMSRVRGGVNSTELRISSKPVRAHRDKIDILIPLNSESIPHLEKRISKDTAVLGDNVVVKYDGMINIPFQRIASEFGNPLFANSVAVGVICGLLKVDKEILNGSIKKKFAKKDEEVINKNIKAAGSGYEIGKDMLEDKILEIEIKKDSKVKEQVLLAGSDAVALGAMAGGCNCAFSYPMTPGTSVFTAFAFFSKEYNIIAEQAEDEIAAINMALGAWYAGARAIVSTSGGGFALMTEGISLSGMTETPAVIHLSQRPGPATGLPTRTEQGDLNLVLYAGHGTFPRIILAPGDTVQAFTLAQKAFNLADKFQVPVFILTDQYFVDAYYNVPVLRVEGCEIEKFIIKTQKGYKRYALTENGISPRGIPGYGEGLVCVDSDEHDETGRITEDLDGVRVPMADKRMKKLEEIQKEVVEPELNGPENYKKLVVGWGSTYTAIKEAMEAIGDKEAAFLHFSQVYPFHSKAAGYLKKAEKIIAVENNQTGQLADFITQQTGIKISSRILKYNGMAFSVEELVEKLKNI